MTSIEVIRRVVARWDSLHESLGPIEDLKFLLAEVDRLQTLAEGYNRANHENAVAAAKEIERLRAALERIAGLDQFELHCDPADFDFDAEDAYRGGSNNAYCEAAEIARESLKDPAPSSSGKKED